MYLPCLSKPAILPEATIGGRSTNEFPFDFIVAGI